ncbi:hypothetical protein [Citricoccus muralis]|uniref:Uncharacterized protein n=1 Tax=Citricoccus muralis TaxID=169134 RepID=A0ABY8H8N3_9MICC|nr:hypothetical protein [Citricoccus muralis]WFP17505.1 hypothetical protein P8192_05195 [Citricoccus muralis]
MELWLIPLLISLAILLGWGSVTSMNRRKLTDRQQRWRALDQRFDRVTVDSTQVETDPHRALAAPGWLDRSNPLVRGFSSTLKRAQQRRAELERNTPAATAGQQKKIQKALEAPADSASRLAPSETDLERYELVVEQLEDAYTETDRAVRMTGWTRPGDHRLPHAQFMLDHRWGRPAVFPPVPALDDVSGVPALKSFLDAIFPVHRDAVIQAVKQRGGYTAGKRAEKALEQLIVTRRYRADQHGILWPAAITVEHWGTFRTFGRSADLALHEAPAIEVANAAWVILDDERGLTEDELLEQLKQRMDITSRGAATWTQGLNDGLNKSIHRGIESLPEGMQKILGDSVPQNLFGGSGRRKVEHQLQDGIREGLVSGRLQRQANGRIVRLRTDWPSTYR